jgi:hypothetical protein
LTVAKRIPYHHDGNAQKKGRHQDDVEIAHDETESSSVSYRKRRGRAKKPEDTQPEPRGCGTMTGYGRFESIWVA